MMTHHVSSSAPGTSAPLADDHPAPLPARTVWVLAIASGMAVANLYYAQPLLAHLADAFEVPAGRMGLAATLAQVGYGLGLLFFVPLGDVLERRGLILALLLAVA